MARVVLRSLWFNAVADLSDFMYLESASALTRADSAPGFFQQTATRSRWVQTQQRSPRVWTVRCDLATADERVWLRAHIGEPGVWVRDHLGQKVCGVYTSISDTPEVWGDVSPISIDITEITVSEAV